MLLPILLLLWGLVLIPPMVRRPIVARAAAASDPMLAFKSNLSRIARTNQLSKPLLAVAFDRKPDIDLRAGSHAEVRSVDADPLLVGFSLTPANPAEAELRRRCVGASLLALVVLAAFAIPPVGLPAIAALLLLLGLTGAFGYAWWRRNQPPSPFAGMATGVPLPSSLTARSFGEAEPIRR